MKIKAIKHSIADVLFSGFCLFWFFSTKSIVQHQEIAPFLMPLRFSIESISLVSQVFLFSVYIIPLYVLFSLTSIFISDKLGPFGKTTGLFQTFFRIVICTIMVYISILPMLLQADTIAWFKTIPTTQWILPGLSVAVHILVTFWMLMIRNFRDPVYREYQAFRKEQSKNLPVPQNSKIKVASIEVLFKIRTKLFVAFVGIISAILLILSTVLLSNYRTTILKAIGDGAKNQVEQASATYRINIGDSIALNEYINRQVELNTKSEFAYTGLTLYTKLKEEIYLDSLPETLDDYPAEFSTLSTGKHFPDQEPLSGERAKKIATTWAENKVIASEYNKLTKTYSYASPIIKIDTIRKGEERIRKERLLGFSFMDFDETVIMRPYFQTRITVIAYTSLFLYLAIVLTYIVGNYIVNPLLFLRMNVRKISDILTMMMQGHMRVSPTSLVYTDSVNSRDEIKLLSTEIRDMVTVLRGIVPYISTSTLKQAQKGIASSTQKELAFLFTDIRGFTTLCEGMEPDRVVEVLNRYLDLETEIILNNHGDVDKFVGDEMMAFFEGPDKEKNACIAAMQIRQAMMEEKDKREKEGLPTVEIGIGINSGSVVFGSVGARDRMDFTSIGDTVNLAARLEGANKAYGTKTLITETVYNHVKDVFLCREIDFIAVKGKTDPVRIYEILQETTKASEKLHTITEQFETGLVAYRKKSWKKAHALFAKNIKEFDDTPSQVYLDRIEHFESNPPAKDWDGVFRMTVK